MSGNGVRYERRDYTMTCIFEHIKNNPGCNANQIAVNAEVPPTEVARYLRKRKFDFRDMSYMMNLRENNRVYYDHLLHDARYALRRGVEGFYINTSKRELFEKFCMFHGYVLSVDKQGRAYVYRYEDTPSERSNCLRVLK